MLPCEFCGLCYVVDNEKIKQEIRESGIEIREEDDTLVVRVPEGVRPNKPFYSLYFTTSTQYKKVRYEVDGYLEIVDYCPGVGSHFAKVDIVGNGMVKYISISAVEGVVNEELNIKIREADVLKIRVGPGKVKTRTTINAKRVTANFKSYVKGEFEEELNVVVNGFARVNTLVIVDGNSKSWIRMEGISGEGYSNCDSIVINGKATSIPEITSNGNALLSHEASVGRIKNEYINYLRTKGLDEDSAISLLIEEMMDLDSIPEWLRPIISAKIYSTTRTL